MPIQINGKVITLMKPYTKANYGSKTVLTDSTFEYVELWLKRQSKTKAKEALFYWQQSQSFYKASQVLPIESKPLTAYYCCMNAAKALLAMNDIEMENISHGVTGKRNDRSINIKNHHITYSARGVLNHLSILFNEDRNKTEYCIYDLLYNIPCIHRTFALTYKNIPELFVPISDIVFETTNTIRKKAYLKFRIDSRYNNGNSLRYFPKCFEKTFDEKDVVNIYYRSKKRVEWDIHADIAKRLTALDAYHTKQRKNLYYILGNKRLWYIKKELPNNVHIIKRSSITLIYGVMHWLSELVRYNPDVFNKLLSSNQNWLIREFINICLPQYIDEISCEITGSDIMCTGYRKQ